MTYESVVRRESVRIAFPLPTLKHFEILTGDIDYVYLKAFINENIYYHSGPEWGPEAQGTVYVIFRALHGLKTNTNTRRIILH